MSRKKGGGDEWHLLKLLRVAIFADAVGEPAPTVVHATGAVGSGRQVHSLV